MTKLRRPTHQGNVILKIVLKYSSYSVWSDMQLQPSFHGDRGRNKIMLWSGHMMKSFIMIEKSFLTKRPINGCCTQKMNIFAFIFCGYTDWWSVFVGKGWWWIFWINVSLIRVLWLSICSSLPFPVPNLCTLQIAFTALGETVSCFASRWNWCFKRVLEILRCLANELILFNYSLVGCSYHLITWICEIASISHLMINTSAESNPAGSSPADSVERHEGKRG